VWCLVSSLESNKKQYSTMGVIESLRPERRGLITYLIDSPTDVTYGYIPTRARNDCEDHRMAWRANYSF
jgi:hypothetical protein